MYGPGQNPFKDKLQQPRRIPRAAPSGPLRPFVEGNTEWSPSLPTPVPEVKWIPGYRQLMESKIEQANMAKGIPPRGNTSDFVDGVEQFKLNQEVQRLLEKGELEKAEEHYLFGKHYRLIPRWPFVQVTIGHPDVQPVPLWDERDLV